MRARTRVLSESGASLVEYALLVALIAVVCLVSIQFFGEQRNNSLSKTSSAILQAVVITTLSS